MSIYLEFPSIAEYPFYNIPMSRDRQLAVPTDTVAVKLKEIEDNLQHDLAFERK